MGMFDSVICKAPVPNPDVQDVTFQTKDLDCTLDYYTISADGRLIHHTTRYEAVPDEERPYYGKPEWGDADSFFRIFGMIRSVPTGDVDLNYHGDLNFYHYDHDTGECWDYIARFTDGALQWIRRRVDGELQA